MSTLFSISTADPAFDPDKPVTINGFHFTPGTQIAWVTGAPPTVPGQIIYGHTWQPYRWQPYKQNSEQARRGIKGRWQAMNEYGGWENARAPDEWAPEGAIDVRRAGVA